MSKKQLPSLLSPALKGVFYLVLIFAAYMLANSLYLFLYRLAENMQWDFLTGGKNSLPKLFQIMILSHSGIGILLTLILVTFVIAHLPRVWRRRHRTSILSGIFYVTAGLVLLVTGLFIFTEAASRNNQWAWWLHVACGLLVVAGHLIHRLVSYTHPPNAHILRYGAVTFMVTLIILLIHSFSSGGDLTGDESGSEMQSGFIKNVQSGSGRIYPLLKDSYAPQSLVSPESPFFLSAATTTSGGYIPLRVVMQNDTGSSQKLTDDLDKHGFVEDTKIGSETCDRCHQDIVAQWSASAHRFASFNNPFYEATVQDLRKNHKLSNEWVEQHLKLFPVSADGAGRIKSKFCGGCHDPALMLTGKMNQEIDRTRPEAQSGLTCLACHAIDKIHDRTGNGNYNIDDQQQDPYLFAKSMKGSIGAFLHDAIIKAKPEVHKKQMLKPVFRSSEYCATCHKVSLTGQLNNYRWLRGQDEYDNWHDSGVSLNASRTFYLPPNKRVCQDCHMPPEKAVLGDLAAKNGVVRSHRFIAINTALPFLRGDTATIRRIERFLKDEKLRVDIFAIKTGNPDETIMAPDENQTVLHSGTKVTVDVVIRNQGVGHTFPGGTNDSNEGWLDFRILAESGKILAESGYLDDKNHLDPLAHVFKLVALNNSGNPINKRNAQDIHTIVFSNVIGPGTADIAHYEFLVPEKYTGKKLILEARLLWRKFSREYTEFAFNANPEGFRQFTKTPDLPVTEIASDRATIALSPSTTSVSPDDRPVKTPDWIRYNDYGIGLFLEGDTRGAVQAFEKVEELSPTSVEGPLNLAKTYIKDGNIDKALKYLQKCEQIKRGDARVAWVWGLVLQEEGQYERAAVAYKRVLEQFPEDRATWRKLGRTYYLNQQYNEALQAFDRVLNIDPEDRITHYHRMLCLKALGRDSEVTQAETAYEYYQVDESAQEITRVFRLKNPGANLMTQAVRTHKLHLNTN